MIKKAIEMTKIWNGKELKVGDKLEGRYIKLENVKSDFGDTVKYIVEATDGEKYGIFGSASLNSQFGNVPVNSYVWVEYKGEVTSKSGRTVKQYEVEYDDEM